MSSACLTLIVQKMADYRNEKDRSRLRNDDLSAQEVGSPENLRLAPVMLTALVFTAHSLPSEGSADTSSISARSHSD